MTAAIKKTRRDYGKDAEGKKRPGVTTVLGETLGWSKNALVWWAAREAAKAAVQFIQDGAAPEEAIERARKAHVSVRDEAAEAGTMAHAYVELFLRTGTRPTKPAAYPKLYASDPWGEEPEEKTIEERAYAAFLRFERWWATAGLEVVHCEMELVDDACDYGGTVDYVLRRKSDGKLIVADLKTGKSIYDEVLVQLGAYSLLLDKHKVTVDEGLVVHVPADGEPHVVPVPKLVLARGAQAFASLLHVFKSRHVLKINLDNLGGTP